MLKEKRGRQVDLYECTRFRRKMKDFCFLSGNFLPEPTRQERLLPTRGPHLPGTATATTARAFSCGLVSSCTVKARQPPLQMHMVS